MRKLLLFISVSFFTVNVWGQTNIFPETGNVGIGTTSPSEKLEVNGKLLINGNRPILLNSVSGDIEFNATSGGWVMGPKYFGYEGTNHGGWLVYGTGDNLNYYYVGDSYTSPFMVVKPTGNVGIGTTSPTVKFEVNGNSKFIGDLNLSDFDLSWNRNQIDLEASPRTNISPMSIKLWDHYSFPTDPPGLKSYGTVLEIYGRSNHQTSQLFFGYDGVIRHRSASYNSDWNNWRKILDSEHSIESSGNLKITGLGDHYIASGNVGIGTTDPIYKLSVKGTIGCGEVKVENVDNWADFVFKPDYNLMSLSELDNFIQENKHLPEIPTAKEVEENGISVGEMNAKLLQKIEELTLYVIELKKENEEQKQTNKELVKRIENLENK